MGSLNHYKVVPEYMSTFNLKHMCQHIYKINVSVEFYNNSRQASRFVFQIGTYGAEGFQNYIIEKEVGEGKYLD